MQIPVNKDIDDYKDDFFKGLTMQQTIVCAITIVAGAGAFFLFNAVLGLPQMISIYLVFPVALPVAAAGFIKVDGMPPRDYLKRRYEVTSVPLYRYQPLVFNRIDSGGNPLDGADMYVQREEVPDKKKETGQSSSSKFINKVGLLGPADEVEVVQK